MKLALLAPLIPRVFPTVSASPWLLGQLLGGLTSKGIDVTLFGAGGASRVRTPTDASHASGEAAWSAATWETLHLSRFFCEADAFDAIHNHAGALALSFAQFTGTPVITTLSGPVDSEALPLYRAQSRQTHFIAATQAARHSDLSYSATILPGLNAAAIPFSRDAGAHLAFVAPIHPRTGLASAISMARAAGRNLRVAGSIEDQSYYREHVAPHEASGHVHLVGAETLAKRHALLGGAAAYLHPVLYDEPFNSTPLEAMACGTPVVAFRKGCLPEVISDSETGFIVETTEEATERLGRIDQLDRAACRRHVETSFAIERTVDELIRITRQILDERRAFARHSNPPWGRWEVLLDEPTYKVKRIRVDPGQRLSYQKHARRVEHWNVVEGRGVVTLDGRDVTVEKGSRIDIGLGMAHRIANKGSQPLTFIEVQGGEYFGEDDIERLDDDYGRTGTS